MKIHVEMSEEEYEFYKQYRKDKRIIMENLRKLYIEFSKDGLTRKEESTFQFLNDLLLSCFEIKEE